MRSYFHSLYFLVSIGFFNLEGVQSPGNRYNPTDDCQNKCSCTIFGQEGTASCAGIPKSSFDPGADLNGYFDICAGSSYYFGCAAADDRGDLMNAGIESQFIQCLTNCNSKNCRDKDNCYASCVRAKDICGTQKNCDQYKSAGYNDIFVCCDSKYSTVDYPGYPSMARYGDVSNNNSNGFFMVPFVIVQCQTGGPSCYVQEPELGAWFAITSALPLYTDFWCDGGLKPSNIERYDFQIRNSAGADLSAKIKKDCEQNAANVVVTATCNPAACKNVQKGLLVFSVGINGTTAETNDGNISILYVHAPSRIAVSDQIAIAKQHLGILGGTNIPGVSADCHIEAVTEVLQAWDGELGSFY